MSGVHPYDQNSRAYNFFFHPLHADNSAVKGASILTNIFLTVMTGFIWGGILLVVNRLDNRKVEQWKASQTPNIEGVRRTVIGAEDSNGRKVESAQQSLFISISDEVLAENPVFNDFLLKEASSLESEAMDNLIQFLKGVEFAEPYDFNTLSVYDTLTIAFLIGRGCFDGIKTELIPSFRFRALEALDPVILEIYEMDTLPIALKLYIKEDYLFYIKCLIDDINEDINNDILLENSQALDSIKKDEAQVSASEFLEYLRGNFNPIELPKLPLTLGNNQSYFEEHLNWVFAALGFKSDGYVGMMAGNLLSVFGDSIEEKDQNKSFKDFFLEVLNDKNKYRDHGRLFNKFKPKDCICTFKEYIQLCNQNDTGVYQNLNLFNLVMIGRSLGRQINLLILEENGAFRIEKHGRGEPFYVGVCRKTNEPMYILNYSE